MRGSSQTSFLYKQITALPVNGSLPPPAWHGIFFSMMKKFVLFLLAISTCLMAVSFVSCSKDDAPGSEITEEDFSYVEPYHGTTCDEATVVDYMKSVKGYQFETRESLMESLGAFLLAYSSKQGVMIYTFTQNKLSTASVYNETKHYAAVQKFLDGKYTFVHEDETMRAYSTPDRRQMIQLQKTSDKPGLFIVLYTLGINPD